MSFLQAMGLAEPLRPVYQKGDAEVTVSYLSNGLTIGEHRVLLKKNFDTACWIPPVGKKAAHSIYYGDRMLTRVVTYFCESHGVALTKEELDAIKAKKLTAVEKMQQLLMLVFSRVTEAQKYELDRWLQLAVVSYGRHEREHARRTPRDLKQVQKDLAAIKVPFRLFNLFEDARIEHLSRLEQGTTFEWTTFEALAPMDHPQNAFLRCIQQEGEEDVALTEDETPLEASEGIPENWVGRPMNEFYSRVQEYYARVCACGEAHMLYPIMREFLDEFPQPESEDKGEPGEGGGGSGSGESSNGEGEEGEPGSGKPGEDEESSAESRAGDLSVAAEAADQGDSFFDEFDEDAEVVGGEGKEADEARARAKAQSAGENRADPNITHRSQGIPDSVTPDSNGGHGAPEHFLASNPGSIDAAFQKRVDGLVAKLMRMFKSHSLPLAMESPGHRLSSRHLARGEVRYVHKKVMGGKGKRRYTIVFDCSGSMQGHPAREGKLFLLALNEIARRGYLEGKLILTGLVGSRPSWLTYSFPVKDELILSIRTDKGAEGIHHALEGNLADIKGMDDVFVYTDACICDTPLDREFFAARRIWPVGLYAGDDKEASEMERHFPQNVIRYRIEEVVEAMLTRNKRTLA